MGTKKRITKDNYQEVTLKRSIIACWIILIICFVIKLFGGNFFEIVCNSNGFITVSNFIESTILFDIIQFISFTLSSYLIVKAIDFGISKRKLLIFLIICWIFWIVKELVKFGIIYIDVSIQVVLEFAVLYIACLVTCNTKSKLKLRIFKPMLFILLLLIFSLVSVFVKNIGYKESLNDSFLTGFIFMIDYYIMIALTYLYQKRRYYKWVLGDGSLG